MKSTKGLRFAIFCRVSTRDQAITGESLVTQETKLRDLVSSWGGSAEIVDSRQEHATAGHSHAGIIGLLNRAEKGEFDALIVSESSRFSRDLVFGHFARHRLRQAKVRLFFGTAEQDLMSRDGEAMASIATIFDGLNVAKLQDQAAATRLTRAHRGWPHSKALPFGRRVANAGGPRTDAVAQWVLDESKLALVLQMYDLYVNAGLTFADIGRRVQMNAETVRRILVNQSGPSWTRKFKNRRTDEDEVVVTAIPRLLSDEQINQVRNRAAHNQVAREKWVRKREYILSRYVRCAEAGCGCANLSGHQSLGNRKRDLKSTAPKQLISRCYPYYMHPTKARTSTCVTGVPAAALEASVIAHLSRLLNDSDLLRTAISAAGPATDAAYNTLITRRAEVKRDLAHAHSIQDRALTVLLEGYESSFSDKLRTAVKGADADIRLLTVELQDLKQKILQMRSVEPAMIEEVIVQFQSLNGAAALQWPPDMQRKLLELFFGPGSTRHLRDAVGVRSMKIGIFVQRCRDERTGATYFTYVAKGRLGLRLTGYLTEFEDLDLRLKDDAQLDPLADVQDLAPLIHGLQALKGTPWFREARPAFTRAKS